MNFFPFKKNKCDQFKKKCGNNLKKLLFAENRPFL